jgi:hypothetical protein
MCVIYVLHIEELPDLYKSHGIVTSVTSRKLRRVGNLGRMGRHNTFSYIILVKYPHEKRPLGRTRGDRKITLRWIMREVVCKDGTWMEVPQNRV